MSASVSDADMPSITGLARMPLLKCASCRLIYSAGSPARLGLTGLGLLPSAPWQAAQTWSTMVLALARSGLSPAGWAKVTAAGKANAPTSSNMRFIGKLLEGGPAASDHPLPDQSGHIERPDGSRSNQSCKNSPL